MSDKLRELFYQIQDVKGKYEKELELIQKDKIEKVVDQILLVVKDESMEEQMTKFALQLLIDSLVRDIVHLEQDKLK